MAFLAKIHHSPAFPARLLPHSRLRIQEIRRFHRCCRAGETSRASLEARVPCSADGFRFGIALRALGAVRLRSQEPRREAGPEGGERWSGQQGPVTDEAQSRETPARTAGRVPTVSPAVSVFTVLCCSFHTGK